MTILIGIVEIAFAVLLTCFARLPTNSVSSWIQNHVPVVTIAVWVWFGTVATFALALLGIGKKRIWALSISFTTILMIYFVLADAD